MKTIERYLNEQGHTPMTIKGYMYEITLFLKTNPQAETYKYKDIIDYISIKQKDYPNTGSSTRILSAIKKYYDYLIEVGKVEYHPCRTIYIKSKVGRNIIHQDLFSSVELALLMTWEGRIKVNLLRNRCILSLLIYQGLMAGEIIGLKTSHVDLDGGKIFIKGTKRLSQRHMEIHPKQYRIFDKYMNERLPDSGDALFIHKTGTPVTVEDISYITGVCKYLFPDRNLNPVTIRQSVISNWLNERKFPMEDVQLMAGHKWMSTTERYKQVNLDEQRKLINKWYPLG